jgi:hypothetical protein
LNRSALFPACKVALAAHLFMQPAGPAGIALSVATAPALIARNNGRRHNQRRA